MTECCLHDVDLGQDLCQLAILYSKNFYQIVRIEEINNENIAVLQDGADARHFLLRPVEKCSSDWIGFIGSSLSDTKRRSIISCLWKCSNQI